MTTQYVPHPGEKITGRHQRCWVVPLAPPSLNEWEGMHWAERGRVKERWAKFVWGLVHGEGTRIPRKVDMLAIAADIVFRRNAHRDATNYAATLWKIVPDVLQWENVGVLTDDDARHFYPGRVKLSVNRDLRGLESDPRVSAVTVMGVVARGGHAWWA